MTEPLVPNIALLRTVLDHIDAHPATWEQDTYYNEGYTADGCGTPHCVAGWALMLTGEYDLTMTGGFTRKADGEHVDPELAARTLLGITREQAWGGDDGGLFSCEATRDGIGRIADKLAAEAGVEL